MPDGPSPIPVCPVLFELVKRGAHARPARLTTTELAELTGLAQQTVSSRLIQLEREGKITRSEKGITITPQALAEMRKFAAELKAHLEEPGSIGMAGRVVTGMGDGKYYMSLDGYRKQFAQRFGILPFKGTLNLELGPDAVEGGLILRSRPPVYIAGFSDEQRTYGPLHAYECKIRKARKKGAAGTRCVLIFPERSHHGPNMLEIVSDKNLRTALGLKDGDEVEVTVKL